MGLLTPPTPQYHTADIEHHYPPYTSSAYHTPYRTICTISISISYRTVPYRTEPCLSSLVGLLALLCAGGINMNRPNLNKSLSQTGKSITSSGMCCSSVALGGGWLRYAQDKVVLWPAHDLVVGLTDWLSSENSFVTAWFNQVEYTARENLYPQNSTSVIRSPLCTHSTNRQSPIE